MLVEWAQQEERSGFHLTDKGSQQRKTKGVSILPEKL